MSVVCTFQGYPCRAMTFERARGYRPSGAVIVVAAAAFPAGFDFRTPQMGALATPLPELHYAPGSQQEGIPSGPAPHARALDYEGDLLMSESLRGETWAHPPVRLFVQSVSTVKVAGAVALVEIRAYDVRFHWDRGRSRRHSFNRRRADGTVASDSVRPDGQPFTREQIAQEVARGLFRTPAVSRVPDLWKIASGSVQFAPNSAPVVNLAQMVNAEELEEPALRLDGSVALYRPGEGFVGYTLAPGDENSVAFPAAVRLDKNGSGQADIVELLYPEDYVVVAGGLRIVSVAADDCLPVLDVDGATFEINDENIRHLTGGRYDTEWLRRFVFLPADFAGAPDLPEPIAVVFRTQAYRLWQVPGVEVDARAGGEHDAPAVPDRSGELDPDRAAEIVDAPVGVDPRLVQQRKLTRGPGPNAHLMPILDRAETVAGRRLPPVLQTYTFAKRHRALKGGGAFALQRAAIEELQRIRDEARRAAHQSGNPDPFTGTEAYFGTEAGDFRGRQKLSVGRDGLKPEARRQMDRAGISTADLDAALQQARAVDRVTTRAGSSFSQQFETALRARYAAEDEAAGGSRQTTLYELGKKFLELEKRANSEGDMFDTTRQAFKELGLDGAFTQEVIEAARKLQLENEEKLRRTQVGGAEAGVPSQTFFVNVARVDDAGSRVYSAARGIFKSSGLAGHLVTIDQVHDLSHPDAQLAVCPVRAVFGATLRPLLNTPPGGPRRPRTGEPSATDEGDAVSDCPGGDNVLPAALDDSESYYTAGFSRVTGASVIDAGGIPPGQELVIQRPDLVELIELDGSTNRGTLDAEAANVAANVFRVRPVVRSTRMTLGRPWPVNCDGLVDRVTVELRQEEGAPCGFETTVYTGSPAVSDPNGATREDPARRGAAALRAQNEAARREGAGS